LEPTVPPGAWPVRTVMVVVALPDVLPAALTAGVAGLSMRFFESRCLPLKDRFERGHSTVLVRA
jgi:hypothetical protein